MKFESKLLSVNLEDCIHWFSPIAATGKSYLSTFVMESGITGISIYTISSLEEFKNLSLMVEMLGDTGLLILDRTDLYLTNEDLRGLVQYKDKRILIARNTLPAARLLKYLKTAYIEYDGTRMVLTDEDTDGRFKRLAMQYYDE